MYSSDHPMNEVRMGLFVVSIVLFVLIKPIKGLISTKWLQKANLWWLPTLVLFAAVSCLVYAPLPFFGSSVASWVQPLLTWVFSTVGPWVGASGPTLAAAVIFLMLFFGLVDLIKDKKPDGIAKTAIIAVPFLALVASGSIAAGMQDLTGSVSSGTSSVVSKISE